MSKLDSIKDEAALVVGLVLTIVAALQDATLNGNLDWRAALPLVAAAVVRQFTYGPKYVEQLEAQRQELDKKRQEAEDLWREFLEALRQQPPALRDDPLP
jgi:hypothetical protein